MKRLLEIVLGLALTLCAASSWADSSAQDKKNEAMILANINKKFPATKVTSVKKAPMGNLYEVVMGPNIAYVDKDTKLFMLGHIYDMENQHDLTQDRIEELNKVDFAKLPLDKAIKVVKGKGKRVFAVFTDPMCPYCRQLEESITELDNYTMYVFLYPIAELHPTARAMAAAIWCSADRPKTFHQALTQDSSALVAPAGCAGDPLDEIAALGHSLGVQGTPSMIHKDGRRAPGAMPTEALDNWLNGTQPSKKE